MRRKQLTLPQKVFVVKNYYQITDMLQVLKSFNRFYDDMMPDESIIDSFYNIIITFEKTGSVQQAVYYESKKGGTKAVEATVVAPAEPKRRGRRPKVKVEEQSGSQDYLEVGGVGDEYVCVNDQGQTLQSTSSGGQPMKWELDVPEGFITLVKEGGVEETLEVLPDQSQDCAEEEEESQDNYNPAEDDSDEDKDEDYAVKSPPGKRAKISSKLRVACRICEKTYTTEFLRSHMRKHDREGCSYECKLCEETFTTYDSFLLHEESHIPVNKYKFKCETCKEKFVSKDKLNQHAKTHVESKSYICEWCGMIFSKPDSLKVHIRTHTGEKPLKCKECNESFAFYGGLKAHMRKHSEGTYKCQYCEKTFVYAAERNVHHREHTNAKPYVCHICNRGCATPQNLHSHMKILHKVILTVEEIQAQNYVSLEEEQETVPTVTYVLTEEQIEGGTATVEIRTFTS